MSIPCQLVYLKMFIFRLGGGIYGDTYVGDVKGLKVAVTRITLNIHKDQITADTLTWLKDEVWFLR